MITISGSVGKNGTNNTADVGRIQTMLNASDAIAPIKIDNRYGPTTFKAILQFQMTVFPSHADWDGLIGRNGKTLRALANPSQRFMRQVIPAEVNAQAIRLGGFGPSVKPATPAGSAAPAGRLIPLRTVTSTYKGLSGERWHLEFPTSRSEADLASPFKENVRKFLDALRNAGIDPKISATFRPLERAWLMHWAFNIAHGTDPRKVPAHAGIDIDWVHLDARGNYDASASKKAAVDMNSKYQSVFKPSLTSNHITGNAIDMLPKWTKPVTVVDGAGKQIAIPAGAGETSTLLHSVGASYGVIKLVSDRPHWSNTGH